MSVVESHSVILQVLQLESGLLLEVVTGMGHITTSTIVATKMGNALNQGAKLGCSTKKIKMSNALK